MNAVKSQPPATDAATEPRPNVSGKLVIIAIAVLALTAAGISWLFRYNATHRAAGFWGSTTSRNILTAPEVKLTRVERDSSGQVTSSATRDISRAHGMMHLRLALLEDRSFDW